MVMMMGNSSGIVANASDRPMRIISRKLPPRAMPISGMATEKNTATHTSLPASDFIASCSGVLGGFTVPSCAAIWPSRVPAPVAFASAAPSPATTTVPA